MNGAVKRARITGNLPLPPPTIATPNLEPQLKETRRKLAVANSTIGELRKEKSTRPSRELFDKNSKALGEMRELCGQLKLELDSRGKTTSNERYTSRFRQVRADALEAARRVAVLESEVRSLEKIARTQDGRVKALTSRAEALKLSHTENAGRSRGDRDSLKLMSTDLLVLQSTLDQSNCVIANLTRELGAERAGGQASAEELTRVQEKLDELDVHVGRGRPDGHRAYAGHRELALKWGTMSTANRSRAMRRHTADISDIFDANGADNWSPAALARVLVDKGLLDQLMGTRPFARKKLELVVALREVLTAEWNAELACFIVNELELSNRKYSKLRLALCKAHDEFWRKKVWYQCPVTGKVINMPEPLVSNHVWKARITEKLKPYDLQLSDDGKISQRAMLVTLKANIRRDAAHLRDFTKEDPAFPCFGIDHAAISRVREFSHGGLTMGGCYRGDAPISEMKHTTLVVGQHHDDAAGLEKMLGPQKDRGVVGIAREFEALDEARELDLGVLFTKTSSAGVEICTS